MHMQITAAGQAALQLYPLPISLKQFTLGSSYGYIPSVNDPGIRGAQIFTGTLSDPVVQESNITKYSLYLSYDVGPFLFGEVALYMPDGTLFALGSMDTLAQKRNLTSPDANSIRIDFYISMVSGNATMWLDLAESNNQFRLAVLGTPDSLPAPKDATPNAYVITGADSTQVSTLAFTDRNGLWAFDAYAYANQFSRKVVTADSLSVTISLDDYTPDMTPAYFGQLILQFSSGLMYGTCRYVKATVISGSTVKLQFQTPIGITPDPDDTFILFSRQPLSRYSIEFPPATKQETGVVMIGDYLSVTPEGKLSVDLPSMEEEVVFKVNGKTGTVTLVANDIEGISNVGKTGKFADLLQQPLTYNPPVASTQTLGGVKAISGGSIAIDAEGNLSLSFTPVKSINGQTGDVTIETGDGLRGLIRPLYIESPANLNSYTTMGIFYGDAASLVGMGNAPTIVSGMLPGWLEVLPFNEDGDGGVNGDVLQRWTQSNQIWIRARIANAWSQWKPVISVSNVTLPLNGATPTVNPNLAGTFTINISSNTTFSFADTNTSGTYRIVINQTGGTITWPGGQFWEGGTAPTSKIGKWIVYMEKAEGVAGYMLRASGVFG